METIKKEDQAKISKLVKVADKVERLALKPKPGWMAVQRDRHDRFYFDGERWRLWRPGTKKHWRNSGKPSPPPAPPKGRGARKKKMARAAGFIIMGIIVVLIVLGLI